MKVLDPAIRVKIEQLLIAGKKPKAIATEVGEGVKPGDIYPIAQELRKAGKLGKPTSGPGSNTGKNHKKITVSGTKKNRIPGDDFQKALGEEIDRLTTEKAKLADVALRKDDVNKSFFEKVEQKIASTEETLHKLNALKEE